MKGLVLMQNGFEDVEAIATIDILKRANYEMTAVNMGFSDVVKSQFGLEIINENKMIDIELDDFDFLVIPGGKAVKTELINDNRVSDILEFFMLKNRLIAAICAAPSLIGKAGYLDGARFTCYPGYEEGINGKYTKNGVEVFQNIITAKSVYYSIEFALTIIEYLQGKDTRNIVLKNLKAE